MSNVLIVSHIADLDGVASAVLAYQHFTRTRAITPSVLFVDYDDAFDKVVEAAKTMDEVLICDICWKMTNISLIDYLAHIKPNRLFFFDHHRSSRDCFNAWKDRATIFFDDSGKSCATDLVWQYMISRGHAPDDMIPIVSAAHSRDLWIRNDPNGCEISNVIDELGAEIVFQALVSDPSLIQIENFPREWRDICKRAAQKLEKSYLVARNTMAKALVHNAEGEMVPVMACIALGSISEVGDRILTEDGGGFIGFIDLVRCSLSFRSTLTTVEKMGFGVNEIACRLNPNGGGHPVASGAAVDVRHLINGPDALLKDMIAAINELRGIHFTPTM